MPCLTLVPHKPPLTAWPSIRRSAHLGWLPGALCYTSSGYFSEPSSPHIPAGQFSCEAWEVGIALELFCTVPGAVPDQNIQVFFCSRCIQLCIYLLIRIFWNRWQIFHLSREKTYSWRFGDMLCIRICACPYVYKYVCVCMPRSRGRWLMDRQFMRESQLISLCRYMYINTTFSGFLRQTAASEC